MLVLTRETNQVIRIGDEIRVMIIGVRGDKVLLGITAPRGVPVDREEVFQRKQTEGVKQLKGVLK